MATHHLRKRWVQAAWIYATAIGVGGLAGCSRSPQSSPPANEQLAAVFGLAPRGGPQSKACRLYLDDSESMRGFSGARASSYAQIVQRLYRTLVNAEYDPLGVAKLSGGYRSLLDARIFTEVASPSFYSGRETPLADVLAHMAADVKKGETAMLVSDLVQSEVGKDPIAVSRALLQIAQLRPEVELLAFQSGFHGRYFVEGGQRGEYQLDREETAGRPYYILAIAPNKASLAHLQRYVLDGLEPKQRFRPTDPAIVIDDKEWRLSGENSIWQRRQATSAVLAGYPTPMRDDFEANPLRHGDVANLRFRLQADIRRPLVTIDNIRCEIVRATFRGPEPKAPVPGAQPTEVRVGWKLLDGGAPQKQSQSAGAGRALFGARAISVELPLPTPDTGTWEAYRIQCSAGEGNLLPPKWVADWSTSSDASPNDGGKTLHLDMLIESMLRSISEKVVFSDRVMVLRRGH